MHRETFLLDNLPLMSIINMKLNIRYKEELCDNGRNNYPKLPGLPHDNTIFRIDGIKFTEFVGEIMI